MVKWPVYDEDQIADVVDVLRSGQVNYWTGPHVERFEKAYAVYLGRRHAIGLANGTLALELALRVIDIRPGDEVIVTPRSFAASAACVPLLGGTPIFADVDPVTQNLTANTIMEKISCRTKAVIVVHLGGWPCDMTAIRRLADAHGIWLIEDCAQAHGAEHDGRPVGAFGHLAAFSFCQDKIITTGGEGGLLAMDDDALWRRAWSYKDHGKSYAVSVAPSHAAGFRWLHESFGTNWRMTSIQAVLGLNQLARLADWNEQRTRNATVLFERWKDLRALRIPWPSGTDRHAWYRFYVFVRPETLRPEWSRDRILAEICNLGVPCFTGTCPEIYREEAFVRAGFAPERRLPVARALGETSLAFLVDPAKDAISMESVAEVVRAVILDATDPLEPGGEQGKLVKDCLLVSTS